MGEKFSFSKRLKSFRYAFEGVVYFFKNEHNAWIHLLATVAAGVLAVFLPLSAMEVIVLILAIGLVWMAELFNTAVENMMNFISSEKNPKIKVIKDLSAAAVFIASLTALAVGCVVFIPKL
jgi:diacylglycerol kinase